MKATPKPVIPRRPRRTAAKQKRAAAGRSAPRTRSADPLGTVEDFFAHAIAIEREAAHRYHELAAQMARSGNDDTAALFRRLAGFEEKHESELRRRTAGRKLPRLPAGAYQWLGAGPTEVPRYEFLFRRVRPHHALLLALRAERRAQAFFENIGTAGGDPAVRRLAAQFAREEIRHVAWVEKALERELRLVTRVEEGTRGQA